MELQLFRLSSEIGANFHGLSKRVDGGVRHLACIQQDVIPIDRVRLVVGHARKQHAAGFGLLEDLLLDDGRPVVMRFVRHVEGFDLNGVCRADGRAAVAGDAFALVGEHGLAVLVEIVHLIRALPHARAARNAARRVALDFKFGNHVVHHSATSANGMKTGVPPSTAAMDSGSGQITRMADSSDAK